MYQDDLARIVTEKLFAPRVLLLYAGLTLFDLAVGYASWRALVRLPDFPYRREMLWGARWMWAVIAPVLGVAMAVTYYGAVRTLYSLTFLIVGKAVAELGIAAAVFLRPLQAEGSWFCYTALGARLRRQPLDMDAWVTARVRTYRKPWVRYGLGAGLPLTLVLMNGYLALAFTYPMDRDFACIASDQQAADAVAAAVRECLPAVSVAAVHAYAPMRLDALDDADLPRIRSSLREILGLDRPSPPREPFHLFIAATPETSPEQGADMLAHARAVLAERQAAGKWQISVYVPKGEALARGEYP